MICCVADIFPQLREVPVETDEEHLTGIVRSRVSGTAHEEVEEVKDLMTSREGWADVSQAERIEDYAAIAPCLVGRRKLIESREARKLVEGDAFVADGVCGHFSTPGVVRLENWKIVER